MRGAAGGGDAGAAGKKGAPEIAVGAALTAELAAEVGRLMDGGALAGADFEALERRGREAALGILGRLVANHLNADRSDVAPSAACGCGAMAPVGRRPSRPLSGG